LVKSLLGYPRRVRTAEFAVEGAHEGGFTLIELMVVLLIIAILLAIAIPTFLAVTGTAKDRSAQSTATNALTNSVAYYQNAQTFDANSTTATSQGSGAGTTVAALVAAEPSFNWVAGTTACTNGNNPPCVSVQPVDVTGTNDGQGIILAVYSTTGTCWWTASLQANPVQLATATTSFESAASGAGSETGATQAGTYYAKKLNVGSANCKASYPQGVAAAWGSSFSNPGTMP